ncbi:hypothetical protein M8997_014160 [Phyllobacterium sp. 21LDTY02-6]|uniref:hypothetical protein n=1 Tax=unclassified Phyllobacterium TaxID=2638441 RepID=UPI0020220233|nr:MULTISPECIES: hypothetical protein [unclassified Phyllobacterium]MCO4318336.1 hypothetical protein [Phyllobacterium sp. 21LDTY02-6]MCX8281257.1 hypothetical protein [Phyllobacterium sp. 0TCS1.6C]MCX8296087.1 hypothetical protein [Phyllobacterium sp. 0TCS1.6A]
MTNEKSWHRSRTVWGAIGTIALSSTRFLDASPEIPDTAALVDISIGFLTAICGVISLFGRISATTRISRKEI